MNVLVTGSSGRVGSSLVREAVEGGYDVECFDLEDGKDVLDLPQLESAAQRCDAGKDYKLWLHPCRFRQV